MPADTERAAQDIAQPFFLRPDELLQVAFTCRFHCKAWFAGRIRGGSHEERRHTAFGVTRFA